MIKVRTVVLAILFGWVALFIPASPADAAVKIKKGKDAYIQLGFRYQARFRYLQLADPQDTDSDGVADSTDNRNYDFDFRRLRIAVKGQLNSFVKFLAQTDIGDATGQEQMEWRDALVTLAFSKQANLTMGLFKVQLTRSRNGSGFGQMNLDRPFVESRITDTANADTSIGGKRDQQIALWGSFDKLLYRVAIADGAAAVSGLEDTLRHSVRVHYAFGDKEGFGYKETYLGKKEILTLGFGYDTQADVHGTVAAPRANTAWTADLTWESKLGSGAVGNVNMAYYSIDVDDSTSSGQGNGWHLTGGYLFPGKTWMPYIRYANWETNATGSDQARWNYGFNYLIKGHSAKIVVDIENVSFESQGSTKDTKDYTIATMQWQLDF